MFHMLNVLCMNKYSFLFILHIDIIYKRLFWTNPDEGNSNILRLDLGRAEP